ncbi:MAG: radical SAM protein [Firmicutes bacterium]|nr:radical SAM protein [Bacillota bacterium]
MLSMTKLLRGDESFGDSLRYASGPVTDLGGSTGERGPVVVWNTTEACNLACVHCYAEAVPRATEGELDTREALRVVDQLADFRVPVVLFSGGEPLLRPDLPRLISRAVRRGIRVVVSTNGTTLSEKMAEKLKEEGVSYVGISLDGTEESHDRFRGRQGAFQETLHGLGNCVKAGLKVGVRFTIQASNKEQIEDIFKIADGEGVSRVCFYHLVPSGRGRDHHSARLLPEETRGVMEQIIRWVLESEPGGTLREVLTVDNHADGPYILLRARELAEERVDAITALLARNGGNRSGIAIASIGPNGYLYPDQFSRRFPVGCVRERSFGEIWSDESNNLLRNLRNRRFLLTGRCRDCAWLWACNGNLRTRAEALTGDFWASDPACYLTDPEISEVQVQGRFSQGKPGMAAT